VTKKIIFRLLVLGLAWTLVPGLAEATENAWHLVTEGHTAHAPGHGDDHAPTGDEHGCTGAFHLCSCHHSQASELIAVAPAAPRVRLPGRAPRRSSDAPREPFLPGLERPPRG
jgi:hypothetical protein